MSIDITHKSLDLSDCFSNTAASLWPCDIAPCKGPEPQHDKKGDAVEKKASPSKGSKKVTAKDTTKARNMAMARTRAASKALPEATTKP